MADSTTAAPTSEVLPSSGLSEVAQEFLSQPQEAQDEILLGEGSEKTAQKPPAKQKVTTKSGGDVANDSGDDGDDIEALAGEGESGDEASEKPKTWKLKANGKEYEVDSEDKLVAAAQRGIAAEQAWQKSKAEIERLKGHFESRLRELEERDQALEKDPVSYIRSKRKDADDVMEQFLLDRAREAMAMEQMTPRERELYLQNKQIQEKLKSRELEDRKANEARETELVAQQKKQIGDVFAKALTDAKIPANNYTVRVMAAVYRAALSKGQELTAEQAAKLTKRQLDEAYSASAPNIEEMPAADFVSKYPKLTEAIRKHLVDRARTKPAETGEVPRKPNGQYQKQKSRAADPDSQWDDNIKKLVAEGHSMRVKNGWF